ncbi:Branched-chain amino acid aminotransferase/4-amino-4-deoxychorismate lyase [Tritonibacter multivorans]|uniref:Branched-chain amino acid aminotransferase/4-amino-4-deoxychorismate lyase n=2 Tax=Tritonibacter multivorans TaxID=928856 RepID=A0A0N7LZ59_9RHOB|nr:Branched-chain amino acid aminotransferase/4-amino-4-deoxychorismate lyase [Tritonibacter multivorans]SFD07411.1 4-amino-4-deoxychorismate lyase [Tritonibacter multivorans]
MQRSAAALGIVFDPSAARAALEPVRGADRLRCRLTLSASGGFDLTLAAFPVPISVMRFKIADTVLDSQDVWLQHKTTRRALYDQARAELPAGVEELVFVNERAELCEGTITNLVLTTPEGDRLTPPLHSGCLPGVFRQSLLESGWVREAVLHPDDLRAAAHLELTNSLRGATSAQWLASARS